MEKNHNIANPYTRITDMGRMTHLEPDSILALRRRLVNNIAIELQDGFVVHVVDRREQERRWIVQEYHSVGIVSVRKILNLGSRFVKRCKATKTTEISSSTRSLQSIYTLISRVARPKESRRGEKCKKVRMKRKSILSLLKTRVDRGHNHLTE